jgi:hypothetical protein
LLRVAGDRRSEPYSNEVNKLATRLVAPLVAGSCGELWREKSKKEAKSFRQLACSLVVNTVI